MAKIKMDVSEYEQMKENTRLLEKTLAKEEELNKKVKELQKEKIELLEDSKYQVQYITKTETYPKIAVKKPIEEIKQRFFRFFQNSQFHLATESYLNSEFFSVFFDVEEGESYNTEPEIITKGLDEVKAELKKEAIEELDKKSKKALEENKKLKEIKHSLRKSEKKNIDLTEEVQNQSNEISELLKKIEAKENKLQDFFIEENTLKSKINECLETNNFFIKSKIRKILKNSEKNNFIKKRDKI